jgi:hypothetical protein
MLKKVTILWNHLVPETWENFTTEDLRKSLKEKFGDKFPDTGKIYHNQVSCQHDVTPFDLESIEKLGALEGEFFVVVYPEAPVVVAWVAVAIAVAAVMTMKPPAMPNAVLNRNSQAASPNNELSNRTNQARINGRIPDIYGTVRSTPDLIAAPYKIFENNKEVEYMHFCIGRGAYEISDIRDGATLIEDMPGSAVIIFGPYRSLNSYDPSNPGANAPDVLIGQIPRIPVLNVKRSNSVNGQVLRPPNEATFEPPSMRFVHPNRLELQPDAGSGSDFTAYFTEGDILTITGATFTNTSRSFLTSALAGDDFEVPYPGGSKIYSADGGLYFPASMASSLSQIFVVGEIVDMEGSIYGGDDPLFSGSYEVAAVEIQGPSNPTEVQQGMPEYFVVKFTSTVAVGIAYYGYLSIGYTGGFDVDLNGVYEIASISSKLITLSNPNAVNSDWDDVLEPEGGSTVYVSDVTIVSDGDKWVGPFTLEAADATKFYANFVAQNGLYKDSGTSQTAASIVVELELTSIDENDDPISDPEIFSITITGSATLREFIGTTLEAKPLTFYGRTSARARRLTPADEAFDGQVVDEIRWRDISSVSPVNVTDFGNVSTGLSVTPANASSLAVKDRKLNFYAQRKLPEWDDDLGVFSETLHPTNDAATILAAICLDIYIGNRAIYELDVYNFFEVCEEIETYFGTSKCREFCYTFDKESLSFEEIINTVCGTIFCVAYRRGSIIKISFEKQTQNSTLLFNHRNKIPKSERRTVSFGYANNNDGIKLTYRDPSDDSINTIFLPENYAALNPKLIETAGVRDHLHAYFHAWRNWNKLKYQNTAVEFEATQEAELLVLNDRILVSDGTRPYSQEGEVLAVDGTLLTLSQNVDLTEYIGYSIFLQLSDGTVQSIGITTGGSANTVILAEAPALPLVTDPEGYAKTTYIIVGDSQSTQQAFLVQEKTPANKFTSTVSAINYEDNYYTNDFDFINEVIDENGYGETGGFTPGGGTGFPPPSGLPGFMYLVSKASRDWLVDVVSAGDIPGAFASFSFNSNTIDRLCQRYRVYDGAEEVELIPCAIDGEYVISIGLEAANNAIAITPYLTDGSIKLESAWIADTTMIEGDDINLIYAGEEYIAVDVVQINPGKFIIVSKLADYFNKTEFTLTFVNYTSPTEWSLRTVMFDFKRYPELNTSPAWIVRELPPSIAVNPVDNRLTVSMQIQQFGFWAPGSVVFTVDLSSYFVTGAVLNIGYFGSGARHSDPLRAFPVLKNTDYQVIQLNANLGKTDHSCWLKRFVDGNFADDLITTSTFVSKSIDLVSSNFVTVYTNEAQTSQDFVSLVEAKLIALGYTIDTSPAMMPITSYLVFDD